MLKIGRTTVYSWVKEITIKRTGKQTNAQKNGTRAFSKKCENLRKTYYAEGIEIFNNYKNIPSFRDFILIYLTEGYRKNRNTANICNSNSRIIEISYFWIKKFKTENNKIIFSIQKHVDKDVQSLSLYWGNLLGIPPEDIRIFEKKNSGKLVGRNWRSEFGVFSITVPDTRLRSIMQALMDKVEEDWKFFLSLGKGIQEVKGYGL